MNEQVAAMTGMETVMVTVGVPIPINTLTKIRQFALTNKIFKGNSGNINNAEAVRQLLEIGLEACAPDNGDAQNSDEIQDNA